MNFTYIFIIRGISYGSHNLACFSHCCYFINDTAKYSYFQGFVSGNAPLPLHPYHSIATLDWHCSVNLHICDALQCHFGSELRCHSNVIPKVHSNATLGCTLHCHSTLTTPMPLSQYTPMPLRSVFGVLTCMFATHSYVTPMSLQYHSIRPEWHCSLHSGLWK